MISSINDIVENVSKSDTIIVMYSGGLDGTYLLSCLKELNYKNILAIHINITGENNNEEIISKLKTLNVESILLDKVDEFTEDYVFSAIKAKALYNGVYPISASLSRPLISKTAVEYVSKNFEKPPVLLHTSNSSQNSLRRFNNSLKDLGYRGIFGTPFEKTHTERIDKLSYLKKRNMAFDLLVSSEDTNIWCREFEYGSFDNIENINIPTNAFKWTKKIERHNEILKIKFKSGIPIEINDVKIKGKDLLIEIRKLVGLFGIGRYIGLEEIASGERVLEIRESPAASILIDAIRLLEMATFSYDNFSKKTKLEQDWIKEASEGNWFGSNFKIINATINSLTSIISGTVSYRLSENSFFPISVVSNTPNYITNRDEFEHRNE